MKRQSLLGLSYFRCTRQGKQHCFYAQCHRNTIAKITDSGVVEKGDEIIKI
jgi:hypothetical protein